MYKRQGYEKTTIQDIVNALGMSKGAIYHHFKSKDEIIEALSERCYHGDAQMELLFNASDKTCLLYTSDQLLLIVLQPVGHALQLHL